MILWFTGISGVGKTLIAKQIIIELKKKFKNVIHLDGDKFRKILGNDLGYTLNDRNRNAERIINFVKFLNNQKQNVVVSANLTSQKYRLYCKKNLKNFYEVNISSNINILKNRDTKKIYKQVNKKNIVGYGIKSIKNNTAFLKIKNESSKKIFLSNKKLILNIIKKNMI